MLVFQQALQAKMVSNGSISPSSDSSKRGSKIDNLAGNLAERLGQVSTSVSSPSLPSFPSAVSSILGHSAFQPQMGALSALAMQLAQNQSGGAMGMNSQSTPHQSVIQPNPSSLPSYLLPKQEQVQQLQQSQPSSGTTPQGFTQTPKRKRQRRYSINQYIWYIWSIQYIWGYSMIIFVAGIQCGHTSSLKMEWPSASNVLTQLNQSSQRIWKFIFDHIIDLIMRRYGRQIEGADSWSIPYL